VISRYALPEMEAIWSDESRMGNWLRIEIVAVEARGELGQVPRGDVAEIRDGARFDVERVRELERVTRHDVAAFVQAVGESSEAAARWIHFGLTSSDVLDTGLALQLRSAADILLTRLEGLLGVVKGMALEHRDTVMIGRTHGVHAEPTSFGHKAAIWAFELDRGRDRLLRARDIVSVGKLSGAVGTYAGIDPRVEELVCARLGLRPAEASSQIIQRDRHAEYVSALALLASTLDKIATEVRHLARTEVREVQEPFAEGQRGSSAMPHKRNPVASERISGLARVVRANVQVALDDVALWHERDISHSSAERVVLPDSTGLLAFMLTEMTSVLEGLRVFPERMRANLDADGGLAFSQAVLLALIDRGLARDEAYRVVQTAAAAAWDGGDFRAELGSNPEVERLLAPEDLAALFDPARFVRNLDVVFDRVEKLPVRGRA
jgi:adenylosuccinate lyase